MWMVPPSMPSADKIVMMGTGPFGVFPYLVSRWFGLN